VATALIGRRTAHWTLIDRDGIADLHQRGHEIGLHTHQHRAVGAFSAHEFRADFEKNRAQLQDIHPGIDPRNFAYPFGVPAFERKRQLASLAHSSRGIRPGINAGAFDAQFLKCVELADARLTAQALDSYLDAAVAQKGWLVFLLHDVSPSPSPYGCSTGHLERALDGVAARGIDIVTIAGALAQSRPSGALAALRGCFAP
jgi:peptidoglycan/xylan/chitin deacetylase (PgdA/CDA1 family)